MRAVTTGPDSTFIFLPNAFIFVGSTYSVEILAETALSSNEVGPVDITIGRPVDRIANNRLIGLFTQGTWWLTCKTRCLYQVPTLVRQ